MNMQESALTDNDDRRPTIKTEAYGEIPLDAFVALNPILKPFRDRGLHYPKRRKKRAVGGDKAQ